MTVMSRFRGPCRGGLLLALLAGMQSLAAQDLRDPTVAPGEQPLMPEMATGGTEGMTVLVRNGTPYLVVGTRLYAVGDKVGTMRVDRISESEVWLHDGRALIKMARFAGIQRSAVPVKPSCVPQRPTQQSSAPAVAPCEDTQP